VRSSSVIFGLLIVLGFGICMQAAEYEVSKPGGSRLREEAGLEQSALDGLVAAVEAGEYGDIGTLLISRNGVLALEMYGSESPMTYSDNPQDVYSITESILSLLVGIAIAEGYIVSVDEPLMSFFQDYASSMTADELAARQDITLEHALTMTAGFEWHETRNAQLRRGGFRLTSDLVGYTLKKPVISTPGAEFNYNNALSHIVSEVLYRATGRTAKELAEDWLFTPLGIETWQWAKTLGGVSSGSWGLQIPPLDLLKIGELCANGGILDGVEIIPAEWIESSTAARVSYDECYDYGYYWWRYTGNCYSDQVDGIFFAFGYADQFMWIAPELELVVVATTLRTFCGDTYTRSLTTMDGPAAELMLWEHILPAVIE